MVDRPVPFYVPPRPPPPRTGPGSGSNPWRRRFWTSTSFLILLSGLLVFAALVQLFSPPDSSPRFDWSGDRLLSIVSHGLHVQVVESTASAQSPEDAAELAVPLGRAHALIPAGNFYLEVDVVEAAPNAVSMGLYEVKLVQDGSSHGAFYVVQEEPDASSVEGVTLRWDVGKTLLAGSSFSVEVDRSR